MKDTIVSVHGRRLWDSRGRPTVEAEVDPRLEAAEIHRKLTGYTPMRPLTHDLIVEILSVTGSEVERVGPGQSGYRQDPPQTLGKRRAARLGERLGIELVSFESLTVA